MIPNVSPHFVINPSESEIKKMLKFQSAFFARWTTEFDRKEETEFWYVINDMHLEINDYSVNTRSKIRRGLKKLDVKRITKTKVLEKGYKVYESSFKKYRSFSKPLDKSDFINQICNLDGVREFWGIFLKGTDKLVAYSQNKIFDNCCDYDEIRFNPKYLRLYPSYSLFYIMNSYYLNEKRFKYVNDGARSISHNTNIQQFLIDKFKFRKAYCNLHIVYSLMFGVFMKISFVLRKLIGMIKIGAFKQLSVLLNQEKIKRSFEKR